jgi:hypothetical protein
MEQNARQDAEHSGAASAKWVQDAEWAADTLQRMLDYLKRDAELAALTNTKTD